jgi:hypothetical protein
MKIFIQTSFFLFLIVLLVSSCGADAEFTTPSKYVYSLTKTNGQKTFVIDANRQIKEIPNTSGSFKSSNTLLLDSVMVVSNTIRESLGRFNFFEFKSETIISANLTDLDTGSTNDLPASFTRNGTSLIVDGDTRPVVRLSDDYDELYQCNEAQVLSTKQANGLSSKVLSLELCTNLNPIESVKYILDGSPAVKFDTISITYYDFVFKKQK